MPDHRNFDDPRRPPYPSDVSERQWMCIDPLIPPEETRGRRRSTNMREVVNGISYRWSTGCVWRMLPHDLPHWATVYTYFRKWQHDGTLASIREIMISSRLRRNANGEAPPGPASSHPQAAHSDMNRNQATSATA